MRCHKLINPFYVVCGMLQVVDPAQKPLSVCVHERIDGHFALDKLWQNAVPQSTGQAKEASSPAKPKMPSEKPAEVPAEKPAAEQVIQGFCASKLLWGSGHLRTRGVS